VAEKKKTKKTPKKQKVVVPEVIDAKDQDPLALVSDGTAVTEISQMQNIRYSEEIIQDARNAFNIEILQKLKTEEDEVSFLAEGAHQIKKLWHSIEALTTHNTLFVVLFLISIGEILKEIKSHLTLSNYVQWRNKTFGPHHSRYL